MRSIQWAQVGLIRERSPGMAGVTQTTHRVSDSKRTTSCATAPAVPQLMKRERPHYRYGINIFTEERIALAVTIFPRYRRDTTEYRSNDGFARAGAYAILMVCCEGRLHPFVVPDDPRLVSPLHLVVIARRPGNCIRRT
jgi:hypothetical protein